MMYFSQVLPDAGERKALRVQFRFGVAVYAHVGEVVRVGRLNGVDLIRQNGAMQARFDVSSEGSAHVRMRGRYAIYRGANYSGAEHASRVNSAEEPELRALVGGNLPTTPVLPGTRRDVVLRGAPPKLPPGNYVMRVEGDLGGEPIDVSIPFTVAGATLTADADPQGHAATE